jgi:GntR family transcriptional regulator/MocR family aminotransferase
MRRAKRLTDPLAGLSVSPTAGVSLQSQLRQRLIEYILTGQFLPGQRLPSSRALAQRLGVARNTALLAYQALIEQGHIIARPRSGLYLNESLRKAPHPQVRIGGPARAATRTDWSRHLHERSAASARLPYPADWQTYAYPFIEGCFDRSLFPRLEWRDASRAALTPRQIERRRGRHRRSAADPRDLHQTSASPRHQRQS